MKPQTTSRTTTEVTYEASSVDDEHSHSYHDHSATPNTHTSGCCGGAHGHDHSHRHDHSTEELHGRMSLLSLEGMTDSERSPSIDNVSVESQKTISDTFAKPSLKRGKGFTFKSLEEKREFEKASGKTSSDSCSGSSCDHHMAQAAESGAPISQSCCHAETSNSQSCSHHHFFQQPKPQVFQQPKPEKETSYKGSMGYGFN